ncbi:Proteasome-activating nucleotidase [Candidatus Gugararchaeum adminiculabundum]|nr:Proteasome-activating nucleotidase [Candidatus Gugararchaeum adminiculabundum]
MDSTIEPLVFYDVRNEAIELARASCLEEFISIVCDDDMNQLQESFFRTLKQGKISEWLKKSGYSEMEQVLSKFKYSDRGDYAMAAKIVFDSLYKSLPDFSQVVGFQVIKNEIINNVFASETWKEGAGNSEGAAILLYGPPGCGKTYFARSVAGQTKRIFLNKSAAELARWSSGTMISSCFNIARKIGNSVLFIDEIDAIGEVRTMARMEYLTIKLLTELDGGEPNMGVLVIGATNYPWNMDPVLMRSGRFDSNFYVPTPSYEDRIQLFEFYSKKFPNSEDVDFEKLAQNTRFYSHSDIKLACTEALRIAFRRTASTTDRQKVAQEDYANALKKINPISIIWFKHAASLYFDKEFGEAFKPMMEQVKEFKEHYDKKNDSSFL